MKIWQMSNEEIGKKLKSARELIGWKVIDCAYHAQCSIPTIHAYESGKGKSVPVSYVALIIQHTGKTFEELFK